ncbi:hypothetical protein V1460_20125 [Streptomyces sp. SCSIO 30461]|uniref:hypothetical protein n=1 Tax=Streptomyces sp. SCSIO 30461 TaxID=3118085 RepID=UPI0030CF8993
MDRTVAERCDNASSVARRVSEPPFNASAARAHSRCARHDAVTIMADHEAVARCFAAGRRIA